MSEVLRHEVYDSPNPYNVRDPQIDDFFGYYPSLEDPNFASYISRKKEFYETHADIIEPFPKRGKLFKHQTFTFRYLTQYDRQLVAHQPATGKTCIMFALAELYKRQFIEADPLAIKRTVVIFKNSVLKFNLIDNLVCRCTDRIYETTPVLQASSEEEMKKAINREIRQWYDFMNYGEFNAKIKSFVKDSDVEEYMSNKIFIVEEAHNLIIGKEINNPPIEDLSLDANDTRYETFFKAFHLGHRNKILLFTATPARNFNVEFRMLINLILPMNNQMPNWSIAEMDQVTFEEAEPYLRGMFSYIRAFDIGVDRIYEGEQSEEMWLTIYPCVMSPNQYLSYVYAQRVTAGEIIEESNIEERQQAGGIEKRTLQAGNLIYPDGTYGAKGGADKYLENINGRWTIRNTPEGELLKYYYSNPEYLEQLSCKASKVVELCKVAYPPRGEEITEKHGIVFIYFPEFVYGSGAADLIPILEANGYEYFNESTSIFGTGKQELRPCASAIQGTSKSRLSKAPRVAFIDSETSDNQVAAILQSINHYDNRYGEYLQVLVVSEVAREGISISNVVTEILYGPSWNYTNQMQAEERVFRPSSYIYRLQEYRDKLGDPEARFPVHIYLLCAIYATPEGLTMEDLPKNEMANFPPEQAMRILSQDNTDTADFKLYKTSERKDRAIRKWMRYGKRADAGCWINYNRNVQPEDVDGSPTCDYDTCAYECAGIKDDLLRQVDWTTKILHYADEEIDEAKEGIRRVFSVYYSVRIDELILLLKHSDKIYILMALEKMINDRETIVDRFGNKSILRQEMGRVYLDKDLYSSLGKLDLTIYNSLLLGTQNPADDLFSQYLANVSLNNPAIQKTIERVLQIPVTDPNLLESLDELELSVKVRIFEEIVTKYVKKEPLTPQESTIMDAYSYILFTLPEPVEGLEKVRIELSQRGKGSGRKAKFDTKAKVKKVKLSNFTFPELKMTSNNELVYVHRLFAQSKESTRFTATSSFMKAEGKLRLYKPSEGVGWRNLTQVENITYNTYLQAKVQTQFAPFEEKFNVYGMMLPPQNKFIIRDKETQASDAEEKTRGMNRGKVCSSWSKYSLVELLTRIEGMSPPRMGVVPGRQEIIDYLMGEGANLPLRDYSDDKLRKMYLWYQSGYSIPRLCDLIEENFAETGRLFRGEEGNIVPEAISEQLELESQRSNS